VRRVDILRRPTPSQRRELGGFVERLAGDRGGRPLSDHLWLDLQDETSDGPLVVSVADESGLLALAQVSAANDGFLLESAVDDELGDADDVEGDALETAVDAFRRAGGGHLTWWVDEIGERTTALAARFGLSLVRTLHEMRVALPLPVHATVATRGFGAGDGEAWLRVNNRAFASHAEQGGWTAETLALRLAEPWFDPDGLRLHEIDGELAAFCWTKVHSDATPPLGEIYVIGVDPAFHGRGLGRQLTLAGLDWMSDHGLPAATLYVDDDNTVAMRLYESLGFRPHRSRFAFAGALDAGTLAG
jgi:mycothiol synthase